MFDTIKTWINEDKPFLGICVGYQLLFEGSDECPEAEGLGILKGKCTTFSNEDKKVPHMGWNAAKPADSSHPMWQGLGDNPYFYFVHSYFPSCENADSVASTTDYGEIFHSAVTKGNTIATQFHPEKSQHTGLKLIKNFLNL